MLLFPYTFKRFISDGKRGWCSVDFPLLIKCKTPHTMAEAMAKSVGIVAILHSHSL